MSERHQHGDEAASIEETTAAEASAVEAIAEPSFDASRGACIGRYVVLSKLGAGAMGVVLAAYDPELDRRVALKLLRVGSRERDADWTRLQREAQALAKLNHPNVVSVHDVGVHQGQVFVAMEFVRGQTLGTWMRAKRTWREVLRVFEAAGRGLAAAHAQGLVHRDFKPDNVMVGEDGRVRVMDFGLARVGQGENRVPIDLEALEAKEASALATPLTQTGAIMGTPAYMAPEQFAGLEVTAKSDQFGYCIALYEALYGVRPFRGESLAALAFAATEGNVIAPPRGSSVPRWLYRLLLRGLSADPAARFADMPAVLDALAAGEARRRRAIVATAVGGVALIAAATAGAIELEERRRIAACESEGASIEAEWNDEARARVQAGLLGTGATYAQATFDHVIPWLDGQAEAWSNARTDACTRAKVTREWDDDMLNRSQWCLDERRYELLALTEELESAGTTTVNRAVDAASNLSRAERCLDEGYLTRMPIPPAEMRASIEEVRRKLARAYALHGTADFEAALPLARECLERAEALGWPPLVAISRTWIGIVLRYGGDYVAAEESLDLAYFEAMNGGAPETALRAADQLAYVVGFMLKRPDDAYQWTRHADVLRRQLPDESGLQEAAGLDTLGLVLSERGDIDEAEKHLRRALAIRENALGPNHPDVAATINSLAIIERDQGNVDRALEMFEQAFAIQRAALGPEHPNVAAALNNVATILTTKGQYAEAASRLEQALEVLEKAFGPKHPGVAMNVRNLGGVYYAKGDYEKARGYYERALQIDIEAFGEDHALIAKGRVALARVHLGTGDADAAIELAERVVRTREAAKDEVGLAEAEFLLAQSLAAGEPSRRHEAMALAAKARETFAKDEKRHGKQLADVKTWLDAQAD